MAALMRFFILSLFFPMLAAAQSPVACLDWSPGSIVGDNWMQRMDLGRVPDHNSCVIKPTENGAIALFSISADEKIISEGQRSEAADDCSPLVGSRIQYKFSFKIPKSFPQIDESVVFAQWHDRKYGEPSQRPPLSIRIVNGKLSVLLWNDAFWKRTGGKNRGIIIYQGPIVKEKWLDFAFDVRWSALEDGFVYATLNNKSVVRYKGPVGYEKDWVAPYFKLGIYTVHPFEKELKVAHRNYSRSKFICRQ